MSEVEEALRVPTVISFEQAIEDASGRFDDIAVLLGNGFSIDYDPTIFLYDSLAEEAELSGLSVDKEELFAALGSSNFESILDKLNAAADLQSLYGGDRAITRRLRDDVKAVRRGLAEVLAARHPDSASVVDDDEAAHAKRFLANFAQIFTLNYDLLLYWVVNRDRVRPRCPARDGFEYPSRTDRRFLMWKSNPYLGKQNVFHLHGALHYFVEKAILEDREGKIVRKLSFGAGRIVSGLRARLRRNKTPLVVTEGTRSEKEARIEKSVFLRTGLRRFGETKGALFLHGVSMSENDDHVFELVEADTSRVRALYVSVHGHRSSPSARQVIERAQLIKDRREQNGGRPLRLKFYEAASAHVWRD